MCIYVMYIPIMFIYTVYYLSIYVDICMFVFMCMYVENQLFHLDICIDIYTILILIIILTCSLYELKQQQTHKYYTAWSHVGSHRRRVFLNVLHWLSCCQH
jgi:hypothetical protein